MCTSCMHCALLVAMALPDLMIKDIYKSIVVYTELHGWHALQPLAWDKNACYLYILYCNVTCNPSRNLFPKKLQCMAKWNCSWPTGLALLFLLCAHRHKAMFWWNIIHSWHECMCKLYWCPEMHAWPMKLRNFPLQMEQTLLAVQQKVGIPIANGLTCI